MADIGSLIVKIGADASGLQKAFNDLGGSASQFQRGMETMGKIGAAAFVAIASSMVAMTIAAGRQAEELQQLSTMTGISTDKLQEYDVLMNRAGLSATDLTTVMRTLSKNMEDARNGTGNAADRFRQLGIDITKVTSTDDLIRKVANSLSRFANGVQKAAIESDLMGKGGLRLALAMEGGARGIDEAAAASLRLGAALSAGQLAELATMDDRIDDLTIAWKRFGQQVGSFVAPAIDFAARALSNLLNMASQGLKGLNALGGVGGTPDDRPQPPKLIDTARIAAEAQGMADVRLRVLETYHQDSLAIAKSGLDMEMVLLDQQQANHARTDREITLSRMGAIARMDAFTIESLNKQLRDFTRYVGEKRRLYTDDEKGRAQLMKFEEEAHAKELSMMTKIALAQEESKINQIRAGLQLKTFWQKQLDDLVASNTFSVGLIVNTWTTGIANAIVNGGNFLKAAWNQTQIAIIQGVLNTGVQLAAEWARQAAVQAGILTATAAKSVTIHTGTEAAKTAISTAAEAERTIVSVLASKAMAASSVAAITGAATAMIAVMNGVVIAIAGVFAAISAGLAASVVGAPFAPAFAAAAGVVIVSGTTALIAAAASITAALAASSATALAPGFATGGIGNFGAGTPATLHGPEAIIPLNSKGARFLESILGTGSGETVIQNRIFLDGREVASGITRHLPRALRMQGVPA